MLIRRLKLKNIKAYKDREFEFSPGINFIKGVNGAGKSTIIESIGYCLFDSKNVGKIEEMISFGEDSGEIALEFEHSGEEYSVIRTISFKQHKCRWLFFENGIPQPFNGKNEILAHIKKIFNLKIEPAKHFEKILGAYQGKFKEPFEDTPLRRETYFNEIFDTEKYRRALPEIKLARDKIKFEIEKCESDISLLEEVNSDFDEIIAETEKLAKEQSCLADEISKLTKKREKIQQKINETDRINKKIDETKVEYARIQTKIENIDAQTEDIESKINKSVKIDDPDLFLELKKYMPAIKKRANDVLPAMMLKLDLANEKTEKLSCETEKYLAEKDKAKELAVLKEQREDFLGLMRSLLEKQKIFEENMQNINKGICPFLSAPCDRIYEAEIENNDKHRIEELEEKIIGIDKKILALNKFENYEHMLKTLNKQFEEEKKTAHGLTGEIDEFLSKAAKYPLYEKIKPFGGDVHVEKMFEDFINQEKTIEKARAYREWVNAYDEYLAEIGRQNDYIAKLNEYKSEKAYLAVKRQECMDLIQELTEKTKDFVELKKEDKQLEAGLMEANSLISSVNTKLDSFNAQLDKKRKHELKRKEKIKEKEHLAYAVKFLADLGEVLRGCGPRVARIMRTNIATVSGKVYSEIASDLSALEFDENYDICLNDYWQNSPRKRYFSQLSGGEKMSAALSVRLALLLVFSPLNIGFFDEPTENLDIFRRENLSQTFLELLKNLDQSFIISHDDTFDSLTENIVDI